MSGGWCMVLNMESWLNLCGMHKILVFQLAHGRLVVNLENHSLTITTGTGLQKI
jgi:hypothetical protein